MEFIQNRVNEIRETRKTNPNKFFSRAQPDSVFRSQQLWTVEFTETKTKSDKTIEKIITNSSIPEIVAKQVKNAWELVFTSKTKQTSQYHKVFDSKKFKQIAKKITAKDEELIKEITENEILEVLNKLRNNTAPGPDNIPNDFLKVMSKAEPFRKVILKQMNACMHQKITPKQWKKSNIYTIYKKQNPNNPLNYRPIALLSATNKIYSSLITKRLSDFLEDNNCLSEMQGGFRRDRPTFAKMWTLKNIIEHAKINEKELHVCYLDIQKAYDSVEYWALDLILKKYGFSKHFRHIISNICENTSCNITIWTFR